MSSGLGCPLDVEGRPRGRQPLAMPSAQQSAQRLVGAQTRAWEERAALSLVWLGAHLLLSEAGKAFGEGASCSLGPFTSGARRGKFTTRVRGDTDRPGLYSWCLCTWEDTSERSREALRLVFPTQVCSKLCLCPEWVCSPQGEGDRTPVKQTRSSHVRVALRRDPETHLRECISK